MTVTAKLDKTGYDAGATMTLQFTEDTADKRKVVITDSTGAVFTKVSGTDRGQGFTAVATAGKAHIGPNTVSVAMTHLDDGEVETTQVQYTVGPQTQPSTTLFGGSLAGDDGGLNLKAAARRGYMGGWPHARFTDEGNLVDAARRTAKGGAVWWSYKGTGSEATLRSFVQSANDYLAALGILSIGTYEHENDIPGKETPVTQFHNGYDILMPIADAEDNTIIVNVATGFISAGKNKASGFATYDKYFRNDLPWWGCDRYGTSASDFSTVYANVAEYAKSKGKPLAVGETGLRNADSASWYRGARGWLANAQCAVACAFDARDTVLQSDEAHAWFGV